jgi:hypothetical protein
MNWGVKPRQKRRGGGEGERGGGVDGPVIVEEIRNAGVGGASRRRVTNSVTLFLFPSWSLFAFLGHAFIILFSQKNGVYNLVKIPDNISNPGTRPGSPEQQVGSPGSCPNLSVTRLGSYTTYITNLRDSSFARSSCLFSLISRCTLSSISRSWKTEWSGFHYAEHKAHSRTFSSSRRSCSSFRRTL